VETVAHLDTHVVVWLYAGELERFPLGVRKQLEKADLAISPAVLLELQYLFEIKRLAEPASLVLADLEQRLGLKVSDTPFARVASAALALSWTRDPFDRLIVAQAIVQAAPLVTADRIIRKHYPAAAWSGGRRAK
jgi:PIN domain nuclease of toxin-antitoxin system